MKDTLESAPVHPAATEGATLSGFPTEGAVACHYGHALFGSVHD